MRRPGRVAERRRRCGRMSRRRSIVVRRGHGFRRSDLVARTLRRSYLGPYRRGCGGGGRPEVHRHECGAAAGCDLCLFGVGSGVMTRRSVFGLALRRTSLLRRRRVRCPGDRRAGIRAGLIHEPGIAPVVLLRRRVEPAMHRLPNRVIGRVMAPGSICRARLGPIRRGRQCHPLGGGFGEGPVRPANPGREMALVPGVRAGGDSHLLCLRRGGCPVVARPIRYRCLGSAARRGRAHLTGAGRGPPLPRRGKQVGKATGALGTVGGSRAHALRRRGGGKSVGEDVPGLHSAVSARRASISASRRRPAARSASVGSAVASAGADIVSGGGACPASTAGVGMASVSE